MNKDIQTIIKYEEMAKNEAKEYYNQLEKALKDGNKYDLMDLEIAQLKVKAYNKQIRKINKDLKQQYNEMMEKLK